MDKKIYLTIFILILANIFVWKQLHDISQRNLEVVFFDVGQGDAAYIETPQNHQILIDGGISGRKILRKLSSEIPFWDHSLDMVMLSHPEKDHMMGLPWALKRYDVKNVVWNGAEKKSKSFDWWEESLKRAQREIIAQKGKKFKIGKVRINILYPFKSLEGKVYEDSANDTSVVARVDFLDTDFLFTGDISREVERKLLEENLDTDVLKVGHHGSKTSSSYSFLKRVSPSVAVISVGKNNSYGHPHQEVLNRLKKFDINILRTDKQGDIEIVSNGESFEF